MPHEIKPLPLHRKVHPTLAWLSENIVAEAKSLGRNRGRKQTELASAKYVCVWGGRGGGKCLGGPEAVFSRGYNRNSERSTSEGKLLEKRHRNHSVQTRETSNSKAAKWEAILHNL